jgi:hypothetical protein
MSRSLRINLGSVGVEMVVTTLKAASCRLKTDMHD